MDPTLDPTEAEPAGEEAPSPSASRKKVKKTVMFDSAMQELGKDAKPLEIQDWIKNHYRVTLKPTLLSTYKGNWMRKHVRGGRPRKEAVTEAPAAMREGGKAATLADIRELQALIARVGKPQVKEMLALLGVH
ncbi:MAG: hypothetical protein ACRC33_20990 [Gemmataceae bacterium]